MESSNEFFNRLLSSSFANGGLVDPDKEILNFDQDKFDLISKKSLISN